MFPDDIKRRIRLTECSKNMDGSGIQILGKVLGAFMALKFQPSGNLRVDIPDLPSAWTSSLSYP